MVSSSNGHQPVLLKEVLECLKPDGADVIVDCTFGRGGYSAAILNRLDQDGRVMAMDADPAAIAHGERVFRNEPRLTLVHKNYDMLLEALQSLGWPVKVNGIVFDLGVSSPQLDDASRGFSFKNDGPLDMRMNPQAGITAADWLSTVSLQELTKVIGMLGEEKQSGRIARRIVDYRQHSRLESTAQLAEIVAQAIPERDRRQRKIHPATKTFQAIRMKINEELEHLERALSAALEVLAVEGVLAVVTFHSLEDRIVKRMFRHCVQDDGLPERLPVKASELKKNFADVARLVTPSATEIQNNPRARSAKLRAIRKLL